MSVLVLAGHGYIASGMKAAVEIILGKQEKVFVIDAYNTSDFVLETAVATVFETIDKTEEVIVITDIIGGSVNNYFITLAEVYSFYLISGINLSLIIQLLIENNQLSTEQKINRAIAESSKGIINLSEIKFEIENFDEEF